MRSRFHRLLDNLMDDPVQYALNALATTVVLVLMFLIFNALITPANAADASLSWTNPTQNEDNSAIPASGAGSLTQTRVEYGTCVGAAFGTKAGEQVFPAPATTGTITGFVAGSTACFRAYSKNTYGSESAASAVASKTWATPKPKPPTGISVTELVAYMAIREADYYVVLPVGTVPGDTVCDVNNGVIANGVTYYAVPTAKVTWTGTVRPTITVAKCS